MDRDVAQLMVGKIEEINTVLDLISDCVSPTSPVENNAKTVPDELRSDNSDDPEDVEPMTEDPEPEPEPETRKKK